MNKTIKEIMRLSFHDSFFVDKNSKESNFEYLDALVDFVLSKEDNEDYEDYEDIANKIWMLDKRIKNIFIPNMEIMPLCFTAINVDDTVIEQCINIPTIEDIKRIIRCSSDIYDYKNKFNVSLILFNWDRIREHDRKDIISHILNYLNNTYGISIECEKVYVVKELCDDLHLTIALNELIYWLCEKLDFKFSHQAISALDLLPYYEKIEMYFRLNKELTARKYSIGNIKLNSIINSIVRPIVPDYSAGDYDFVFTEMSNIEKNLTNAYIYLHNELCIHIYESVQTKLSCAIELNKKKADIQKTQEENELLRKSVSKLQYDIEKMRKDRDKEKFESEKERKVIEKELFPLREYIFNKNHKDAQKELGDDKIVYQGDYTGVVIVGGHSSWHKKVIERLNGINILSTDQNVIDWSFMNHIEIVVIVTNYISHSMYYRVIDKVKEQELIYLDYKNIDQMKCELDATLMKIKNVSNKKKCD